MSESKLHFLSLATNHQGPGAAGERVFALCLAVRVPGFSLVARYVVKRRFLKNTGAQTTFLV